MAMTQSGLRIDADNADRVGVMIGSGIGGFEVIEREHSVLLERGPERQHQNTARSAASMQHGAANDVDGRISLSEEAVVKLLETECRASLPAVLIAQLQNLELA